MPILVKACRTGPHDGPNDGASGARRTVSPGRREARQQPSQGSFWPFPLRLNPKLRRFDPKSSDFSQFKPRNIIKTYPSQIIKSKLRKLEAREEKKSSRTLVQELHKLPQFQPRNLSIFPWISSPSMWDFTSGFLSPIGSLVFSQILDYHIMIRPRVSRTSTKLHELISYMFQIRFPCYYSDYCMNFRTLAMYFFSSWITHARSDISVTSDIHAFVING